MHRLIPCSPPKPQVGWALHWVKVNDTIIFIFTFLAIIPLAKLLGFGTEELALRVGQTLGGREFLSSARSSPSGTTAQDPDSTIGVPCSAECDPWQCCRADRRDYRPRQVRDPGP